MKPSFPKPHAYAGDKCRLSRFRRLPGKGRTIDSRSGGREITHIKHGKRPIPFSAYELPYHAIDYALKTAGIHLSEVDHIAYSFDPGIDTIDVYPGHNELYLASIRSAPLQLVDGYPHHLPFKNIWVQPAAGDSGTALGAALWVDTSPFDALVINNFLLEKG